jgi:integrase
VERRLARSTVKGYRDSWRCHIANRVGDLRVRDFRTVNGEKLMEEIEYVHGKNLAHATYRHIKVTLSAIFTHARRKGIIDGGNPMQGVSIPKGKKHGRQRDAYTLEEIVQQLGFFEKGPVKVRHQDGTSYTAEVSVPMVRAIIGVAAFTGLRKGEIRGLTHKDDTGDLLLVQRCFWRTEVRESTKTGEDEDDPGVVPIVKPLRALLDKIRTEQSDGWLFPNTIGGSIDLDNLADRVLKPVFQQHGLSWKGWQAYRRGLGTTLKQLGIEDGVIQAILRHQNVATTRRYYIKTAREETVKAMQKLDRKIRRAAHLIVTGR